MKDRYHKKANVLGIDVSVMRVDMAVNVSMELMAFTVRTETAAQMMSDPSFA